ncbi:MAG: hypothetical protein JSV15_05375 [Candidatus Bathyarchaeota archaeon]|nr:MAG: hypothetical protein JSV15_05375 [Candidatus Bathyarchaeota archaeon]
MKTKIIVGMALALFLVSMMPIVSAPESGYIAVTQLGVTHMVDPIEMAQSAVDFYDYWSASGHTPFMEDLVSKIYVYKDTTTGELSLIMHHSIDNSASGNMRVNFNLEGVPAGAYTALSDDPSHAWNATRPGGHEFDLALEPEGNWYHGANSDGGVIGGLPTDEAWCITVNPDFIIGIDAWRFKTPTEAIELDMEHPITICYRIRVYVDIKPGSWPNPFSVKSGGVLPVAICGTEDFDVTTIDPETVQLTLESLGVGVTPLRWSYEDVATPYEGEPCSGHDLAGDGHLDLTLKFNAPEVVETLGLDAFEDRDMVPLILTGNLKEEHSRTPIQGQDCMWILE